MSKESAGNLYFIEFVDVSKQSIHLWDFIDNKKSIYIGTPEEIKFYNAAFEEAMEYNIYLFVEYDTANTSIVH
ncbi:hypothetical protein ACWGNF_38155 [Streptomyces sp. NPDC055808]